MTVEDKRNDPSRRPNNMAVSWGVASAQGNSGGTKHYADGGPEDEAGFASYHPVNGGGYRFTAEYYNPLDRGTDNAWTQKEGDFVVKSPFRAMRAGESLLRRMQSEGGMY